MILSHDGGIAMRTFDRRQEDEANWLAWCLLLPRETLVRAKQAQLSTAEIAARFGVTEALVTFRLNVSGVEFQFAKRNRRRA